MSHKPTHPTHPANWRKNVFGPHVPVPPALFHVLPAPGTEGPVHHVNTFQEVADLLASNPDRTVQSEQATSWDPDL